MQQIIECVPNFSEGQDLSVIDKITDTIKKTSEIKLLGVEPGFATNRTVVTFVGSPDAVIEAAFNAIKRASELIDMSKHKGEHPRFGATDVCPLVPVSGISMEEVSVYADKLAKRVGEELNIPVYCYEYAAKEEKRKNLAACRAGEYEALKDRIPSSDWHPDYGPRVWSEHTARTGATAISARNFLIAYNINLNTTSVAKANSIAYDVREKGRVKREGHPVTGKKVLDNNGKPIYIPGKLKSVKAIGWYIDEFGIAQISMNLTDISITSLHEAFDAVCESAASRGIRVTGSELVGVLPLSALTDAGKFFLKKQGRSSGVSDSELIKIAIKSMGLDELSPFNPKEKVIEYQLEGNNKKLVNLSLKDFCYMTASEAPAPGGGSISAYLGALGGALSTMVANLTANKYRHDDRWKEFSDWAEKGKENHDILLKMVDEDTEAFNKIMDAFSLPKKTEEEKKLRTQTIQNATVYATKVPLEVMKICLQSLKLAKKMAEIGMDASASDAGVAALAARSGVMGAYLNVKINAYSLDDKDIAKSLIEEGEKIEKEAKNLEEEVLSIVNKKIIG